MAAPGFFDQSNASDIAVQGAAIESIEFQQKSVEEACLQYQEGLEQINRLGA